LTRRMSSGRRAGKGRRLKGERGAGQEDARGARIVACVRKNRRTRAGSRGGRVFGRGGAAFLVARACELSSVSASFRR
jgi:hypothetical protein